MPEKKVNQMGKLGKIEEEHNCLGYFGFGSGVSLNTGFMMAYCNGCPLSVACWETHRNRVQEIFPDIAAKIDELGKEKDGTQKIIEFVKKHKTEPYIAVMQGNMEDAGLILSTGKPKDRKQFTLKYPFEKLT